MNAKLKDALRPYALIARRVRRDRPTLNKLAWAQPPSFSQFGEDRFLTRYFEDRPMGFYVDVGAYHPFNASNTFLLYDRGWSGINLEPAPEGLAQLSTVIGFSPRAAIGSPRWRPRVLPGGGHRFSLRDLQARGITPFPAVACARR